MKSLFSTGVRTTTTSSVVNGTMSDWCTAAADQNKQKSDGIEDDRVVLTPSLAFDSKPKYRLSRRIGNSCRDKSKHQTVNEVTLSNIENSLLQCTTTEAMDPLEDLMDAYRFTIYSIATNNPAAMLNLCIFDYTRNWKGRISGCKVNPSKEITFNAFWDTVDDEETGVCVEVLTRFLLDSNCALAKLAPFE